MQPISDPIEEKPCLATKLTHFFSDRRFTAPRGIRRLSDPLENAESIMEWYFESAVYADAWWRPNIAVVGNAVTKALMGAKSRSEVLVMYGNGYSLEKVCEYLLYPEA